MPHYPFFGNPAVYVDPTIVTFTASPALAERGSSVEAVTLRWSTAKSPDVLKLNGDVIWPFTRQAQMIGPFEEDTSWKLQCADTQQTVQGKASISFCNNVHYGFVTVAPTDSAGVNALDTKTLQISRKTSVTVAIRAGEFFCYAYPARLGAAKVTVDATSDRWQPTTVRMKYTNYATTTVSVTNDSGYTEDYTLLAFNSELPGSTVIHVA